MRLNVQWLTNECFPGHTAMRLCYEEKERVFSELLVAGYNSAYQRSCMYRSSENGLQAWLSLRKTKYKHGNIRWVWWWYALLIWREIPMRWNFRWARVSSSAKGDPQFLRMLAFMTCLDPACPWWGVVDESFPSLSTRFVIRLFLHEGKGPLLLLFFLSRFCASGPSVAIGGWTSFFYYTPKDSGVFTFERHACVQRLHGTG